MIQAERSDLRFSVFTFPDRLTSRAVVTQVVTGVNVDGGGTAFWGLAYMKDEPPGKKKVEPALREAGFDFVHNVLPQTAFVSPDHSDGKEGRGG